MGRCRDCDAEIVWAENRTTRRVAPINAEPVEGGNIVLHGDGTYSVDGGILTMPDTNGLYYVSHFVTCPKAEERRAVRNRKRRT